MSINCLHSLDCIINIVQKLYENKIIKHFHEFQIDYIVTDLF